jgi:nicotinamidase/pyrazinamidase
MIKTTHITGEIVAIGVDMQNDFCPGGSLEVAEGDQAVKAFNVIAAAVKRRGGTVLLTRDWHPTDTNHFSPVPDYATTWPVHCVAGTEGAAFHPALDTEGAVVFSKGMQKDEDAYSGFMAVDGDYTPLPDVLQRLKERGHGLTLIIGGLATDYCVRATALDAAAAGYEVFLPVEAVRAVNPTTGKNAFDEMLAAGIQLTTTEQVLGRLA